MALRDGAVLLLLGYAKYSFACLPPARTCRATAWLAQECNSAGGRERSQRYWATRITGVHSQMLSSLWITSSPRDINASGGGLLMATINAPQLFQTCVPLTLNNRHNINDTVAGLVVKDINRW